MKMTMVRREMAAKKSHLCNQLGDIVGAEIWSWTWGL